MVPDLVSVRSVRAKAAHTALLGMLGALALGCPKPSRGPNGAGLGATQTQRGVDGERLLATVAELASDGLGGRYSLNDPDIRRAANYLADELKRASVEPVGGSYLHDFKITIGAVVDAPPRLDIVGPKTSQALASSEFVPLGSSASGTAEGEVVFVGYAAQGHALAGSAAYDDLEGVSVKGKIALVVKEAPDSPNMRELYLVLRRERNAFERAAEPLRAAKDTDALTRLHVQTRSRLAEVIKPYMHGRQLPEELLVAPSDPQDGIELADFAGAITPSTDDPQPQFMYSESQLRTKLDRLTAAGAVGVIFIDAPHAHAEAEAHHEDSLPDLLAPSAERRAAIPVVQMKWTAANELFRLKKRTLAEALSKIDGEFEPQSGTTGISARIDVQLKPLEQPVPNVLGMIRGTDRPDEVIMLGAHYDHIGSATAGKGHCKAADAKAADRKGQQDLICNGADDNASGTAVVVEVARAFASTGYRPKRTIVFALFAGEELGLLGSQALAEEPPRGAPWIGEGRSLVGMINIDMVGRLNERGLLVGGVGSSPGWMPLFDEVSDGSFPIVFDRTITTRSDHASFYRLGVPVVFFFTGVHDDYHAPGDETGGINAQGLTSVAQFTHDLTLRLGDGAALAFAPEGGGLVSSLPGDNENNVVKRVGFPGE